MITYREAVDALQSSGTWDGLDFDQSEVRQTAVRVDHEVASGLAVFPAADCVFAALRLTPLDKVRAVIIGQDPYPTRGNAHGLAFSVPPDRPVPASLKTMHRSLAEDFGFSPPNDGDLTPWTRQGVLLLNTVLTVREGQPHSHKKIGWLTFSQAIVKLVSARHDGVVFLLWGGPAQSVGQHVDQAKHGIVACAHPSPLNAQKGGRHPFIDAHPFRMANAALVARSREPIDWRL